MHKHLSHKITAKALYLSLSVFVIFIEFFQLCVFHQVDSKSAPRFAVLDKQSLFNRYYRSIKHIASQTKDPETLKNALTKKNAYFIKSLSQDLVSYENKHHVVIMKRAAILVPNSEFVKSRDITPYILKRLKAQGVLL